jgi:hypothetical protein
MADQVGLLGALRNPASPRPIRNRNPKSSEFLSPATQQQFISPDMKKVKVYSGRQNEIPHLKMKYLS